VLSSQILEQAAADHRQVLAAEATGFRGRTPGAGRRHIRYRQIRASDAPALVDGFHRLSDVSKRYRFLQTKTKLTEEEIRYFTDVDHHDHEAIVAVERIGPRHQRGVGVARFIRDRRDPMSAEIAVTVVDEWQGRGIGTQLVRRLARRARREGIVRLSAYMSADNYRARRVLNAAGGMVRLVERDGSVATYEVLLNGAQPVAPVQQRRLIPHAAA
jgi:RimJ/RimL family protein N-acetyltransferase